MPATGLVTDIQRFSLNDGPGIRTTVFAKGCNMRCSWCHNPETISPRPELQFLRDKCIACQGCRPDAPDADIFVDDQGKRRQYKGNCHAEALVKVGRSLTPNEILEESLQDLPFYENSRGGVTLSGGEITTQFDFALETLSLLKRNGIHTAIESNIALPWESLEKLLPVLDLLMFDIKIMDTEKHREWTGIPNERILSNARMLSQTDTPLIVRTPLIPGFNDSPSHIAPIAHFVASFPNLQYYELLPFNPLGADKYRCLGKPYLMEDVPTLDDRRVAELRAAARSAAPEIEVRVA
jgi:pyruvate formate lyase activating enzyme